MRNALSLACAVAVTALGGQIALAQTVAATSPAAPPPAAAAAPPAATGAPAKGADALSVYFDSGSARLREQDAAVLDKAARSYRDGKPIVMVVSGATDAVGPAQMNLQLSQARADTVLQGLVSRGIPVDRFQVLAKGETEPAVVTPPGVAEARNRRVDISWR